MSILGALLKVWRACYVGQTRGGTFVFFSFDKFMNVTCEGCEQYEFAYLHDPGLRLFTNPVNKNKLWAIKTNLPQRESVFDASGQ